MKQSSTHIFQKPRNTMKIQKYRCTLAEVRDDYGITLQELASAVGISRQALSAIEKNTSEPSASTALILADYFAIPVEALFEELPKEDLSNEKKREHNNEIPSP